MVTWGAGIPVTPSHPLRLSPPTTCMAFSGKGQRVWSRAARASDLRGRTRFNVLNSERTLLPPRFLPISPWEICRPPTVTLANGGWTTSTPYSTSSIKGFPGIPCSFVSEFYLEGKSAEKGWQQKQARKAVFWLIQKKEFFDGMFEDSMIWTFDPKTLISPSLSGSRISWRRSSDIKSVVMVRTVRL